MSSFSEMANENRAAWMRERLDAQDNFFAGVCVEAATADNPKDFLLETYPFGEGSFSRPHELVSRVGADRLIELVDQAVPAEDRFEVLIELAATFALDSGEPRGVKRVRFGIVDRNRGDYLEAMVRLQAEAARQLERTTT